MKLRRSLLSKNEQAKIYEISETVEGWLSIDDAANLFYLASQVTGKGAIVEIGSWKGKSTIFLALGSLNGKKSLVYAIDPHTGSPEHTTGKKIYTFDEFKKNIRLHGVEHIVKPLIETSHHVAQTFHNPVELIFVDGAHDYESVKMDFDEWYPKVVNGGWMVFHDSVEKTWPGVVKVVDEEVYKSNRFKNIHLIGVTTYAQKSDSVTMIDRMKNWYVFVIKSFVSNLATVPFPTPINMLAKKVLQYIQ